MDLIDEGNHVLVAAPRRVGKTSLVRETSVGADFWSRASLARVWLRYQPAPRDARWLAGRLEALVDDHRDAPARVAAGALLAAAWQWSLAGEIGKALDAWTRSNDPFDEMSLGAPTLIRFADLPAVRAAIATNPALEPSEVVRTALDRWAGLEVDAPIQVSEMADDLLDAGGGSRPNPTPSARSDWRTSEGGRGLLAAIRPPSRRPPRRGAPPGPPPPPR